VGKKIAIAVGIVFLVVAGSRWFLSTRPVPQEDYSAFAYPGSRPRDTDSFAKRLTPRDRARLVKAEVYITDDPPDKVIAYYKDTLKGKARQMDYQSHGRPTGFFEVQVGDNHKFIMVYSNEDTEKTEILISSVLPADAK
jgi:hypothetical protein